MSQLVQLEGKHTTQSAHCALQVALVWREGDDEEGVVTYEELALSVRKVSRALQKVAR